MNVSVCVTVRNEEKTIGDLIMGLLTQTKKPSEIIIVDGGSEDRTVSIIKHYQRRDSRIKLFTEKVPRALGRNIAVAAAKNELIAITDAGCIPNEDWLDKLTKPFEKKEVEVVAGFYDMKAQNAMQKAFSVFLGTLPVDFDHKFLPSARSMAFRKSIFEKQSGFPVLMTDTAEDSLFAANLVRSGVKITRVKSAKVEWGMPGSLREAAFKFYRYALGDARSGIWIHPIYGIWSHNTKALLILVRYAVAVVILLFGNPLMHSILLILILLYLVRAFGKVYRVFREVKSGMFGILVQVVSDVQIMRGLLAGLVSSNFSRI